MTEKAATVEAAKAEAAMVVAEQVEEALAAEDLVAEPRGAAVLVVVELAEWDTGEVEKDVDRLEVVALAVGVMVVVA